jgi:hypothetical protein
MKTIQFEGNKKEREMLLELISYTDAPLPKKVEVRVYALNINKINTLLSDPEFQNLAEEEGRVYSLGVLKKLLIEQI